MTFNPVEWADRQKWSFARTQPRNPHWYLIRAKVQDDEGFDAFIRTIRAEGVERVWGRKRYIVWYAPDGHHYWTMGYPIAETTAINRTRSEDLDQTTDPDPDKPVKFSGPDGLPPRL